MAGTLQPTPGASLRPSPEQVALQSNYLGSADFNYLSHELPDTYEREFERYGDRSISSFLRLVGSESASASDLIKWSEQGRLHTKYADVTSAGALADDTATLTVADAGITACNFRVGQTVFVSSNTTDAANVAIVTAVSGLDFTIGFYEAAGQAFAGAETVTCFVFGSEFKKGTNGMQGSLEAKNEIFENSPIIIKDKYEISGSDMAQMGWIEVEGGFYWYLKSEHETRLRFDDYLEMSMVEAKPAEVGSGAASATGDVGNKGTEGLIYTVSNRGNVWNGGNPSTLADVDAMVERLDKQGSINENVFFNDRQFGFDIDDMLAAQNSQAPGGTSYGLFDNDEDMALNLGFTGFKRGYDFYKTDWKYLNDATLRGGINGGAISGVMVPAGTMTVYDQVLGENAKRPFLHVRYRETKAESRKYKTWMTGSAGGSDNSDLDAMQVHFLSERSLCTLGANNFFIFEA